MKRNMKEWALALMNNPKRPALPLMTHPGIELIGKHVIDAVTDGEVHYEAIKALYDRYPEVAACMIMDLSVEAEAFGATVNFEQDANPTVVGRLVADAEQINALGIPPVESGRIPQILKAVKLASENLDIPVLAGCIGPYSLAGRLYDITEMMMGIYIDPDAMRVLLDKCTRFLISYCKALKAAGANGVVMAEPAAGLLSDNDCRQFSSEYVKQIVDAVQDDNFMVILHNCGNTGHCTGAMVATGAMAYHFGNSIDMADALAGCGEDVLVMGNLDPAGVFRMADAQTVYDKAKSLLDNFGAHRNFILSSGCDIPPGVPVENIEAFYRALNDYNNR
ncbi:MAG: uroporphyrinogen decarboxylase family protein [Bacteroidales bacterium]|nr:uroporphyrinogen decarboxylase family protein [Bacteroidales bacterium]